MKRILGLITVSLLLASSCKPAEPYKDHYPVTVPGANTGTDPSTDPSTDPGTDPGTDPDTPPVVIPDVPFTNPVRTNVAWPDPTIWKDGNNYYTIATGSNTIWKSTDLVHWSSTGNSARSNAANTAARAYGNDFWAPDVIKIGNYWLMYLSIRNSAADSNIGVFKSLYSTGPFQWVGIVTSSKDTGIKDTIDPEVVIDPDTGKVWLFFGSVGKMHRVELDSSGLALAAGATYTHVAGLDINQNSSRSKVYEGCYLHKHGDYWYLFASAGLYSNYTYKLVVGRSSTLTGDFVDKEGRKMKEGYALPVISSVSGDAFYGPGHNGEIFTDSTGQDYILYHCHNNNIDPANPGKRYLMLQRLFWGPKGWPYVQDGKPAATDISPKF